MNKDFEFIKQYVCRTQCSAKKKSSCSHVIVFEKKVARETHIIYMSK